MIPIELSISKALIVLEPLTMFLIGMAIYSIFIFKFYTFLARKDIFKLDLNQYNHATHPTIKKGLRLIFYVIEYIVLFPVFVFFWFSILTILLSFLAKEQAVQNVLLVSIAVVGAVRITAYYNEDLSRDLAKMLPFALLGIFLVNISYFSIGESMEVIKQIPSQISLLLYYLFFVILLEFVLRIIYGIAMIFIPKQDTAGPKRQNN